MVGTLDDMIRDANGVIDYTHNGKCSNCGECCSDYLPVSRDDIARIHRYVEKHGIKEHRNNVVNAGIDLTCPFRDNVNRRCDIYPVRPGICREFKCDYSPTKIAHNKGIFHERHDVVSMRKEFFGYTDAPDLLSEVIQLFGKLTGGVWNE